MGILKKISFWISLQVLLEKGSATVQLSSATNNLYFLASTTEQVLYLILYISFVALSISTPTKTTLKVVDFIRVFTGRPVHGLVRL